MTFSFGGHFATLSKHLDKVAKKLYFNLVFISCNDKDDQ